jgi:release factor glutamine methyltransferase
MCSHSRHFIRPVTESAKTVLEVITSTTAYFSKHGIESPRLNSEHIVAHVLAKKRIELYLEFDRPLFEQQLSPLRKLIRQRAQGKPLQHLLGTVDFHGLIFACDERALVPRPETEQLVEFVLKRPELAGKAPKLIDVGTGSGIIALTLASEMPGAEVHAVDLSAEALALARQNAASLRLTDRVKFFQGDLLNGTQGPYDLVVANLPYIASDTLPTLSREVQCDPRMALDGGADGLEIISRLIVSARNQLTPGGVIALEIGHDQADALKGKLAGEKFQDIQVESDYQGFRRFLFAKYG